MPRPLPIATLLLALLAFPATSAIAAPPEPRTLNPEPRLPTPDSRPPTPDSLSSQIDSLIESAAIGPLALLCTDADFVRRVYLDLTGVIPTDQQARDFVVDAGKDKRQRLIDDLLASPAFLRHMTITLDVMLMERKPEKVVKQPEWEAYLYQSLAGNKPLDQLFRELIAADTPVGQASSLPTSAVGQAASLPDDLRPAARFILDRDAEPNLITRDLGRLAFGMDLQCCQCHDHPLIDDYYQDDYYGLYAFVQRTSLFTDTKSKLVSLTEKADGEASFKSVFTGASSDKALPRLPKGAVLFVEPTFAAGEEYTVKPDKTVRGIPKFSRRAALAEMVPTSREFSRNLANRLWATIFGRGIVHPLDFHYAANPPANPRLLTLLADELSSRRFQLRPFLRELALTRAYQRSCDTPQPDTINFADIAARHAQLILEKSARQNQIEPLQAALADSKAKFKAARETDSQIAAEFPPLEKSVAEARQSLEKLAAQRRTAEETVRKIREQSQAISNAVAKLSDAATALPEERTLRDAADKIAVQSAELNQIADAAAKSVSQQDTGEADAAQELANAEAALAAATAKRPTPQILRDFEQSQLSAQHRLSDAQFAIAQIDAQIANAKAITDYASLAKTDPIKATAAWAAIVEKWTIHNQVAALKPLTPEQFAASSMQATGMLDAQLKSAAAKAEKSLPEAFRAVREVADKLKVRFVVDSLGDLIAQGREGTNPTAKTEAARIRTMEQQRHLLIILRSTFTEFVRQYGGLPGEEFQATVNQALFFGNGNTIDAWLKPTDQNLIARLAKLDDTDAVANEIYWSVYSRPPTDAERQATISYLKDRPDDKPTALSEIAWALLSSTEFRFNH